MSNPEYFTRRGTIAAEELEEVYKLLRKYFRLDSQERRCHPVSAEQVEVAKKLMKLCRYRPPRIPKFKASKKLDIEKMHIEKILWG